MAIRGVRSGAPVGGGGGLQQIAHSVQIGETLDQIAQQHGVSKKDLIKENPQLKGAVQLKAGMQLTIPSGRRDLADVRARSGDTFESSARRSFKAPITGDLGLPGLGRGHEAKYTPVKVKDETAPRRLQHSEAEYLRGDQFAQKLLQGNALRSPGKSMAESLRSVGSGRSKRQEGKARGDELGPVNLSNPTIDSKTRKTGK